MSSVRAYAPGRVELAGNHVDHQGGRVIAAAIDRGVDMVLSRRDDMKADVESEGYPRFEIDVEDVGPQVDELGSTAALVRGVVAGLRAHGVEVGGFDARVKSSLLPGGGLSSSAAFELALCQGLALLFDGAQLEPVKAALIGQAAERDWFGKPCGLMDQLAAATGGLSCFDFGEDPAVIESIDCDFASFGHALVIVDVHCDHSRYAGEYAQVAIDMDDVAQLIGVRTLRELPFSQFMRHIDGVRATLGDLPALRALHFYNEMQLVGLRERALRNDDFGAFLEATRLSAASSAQYLQNVATYDRAEQPAMMVLALADFLLAGRGAARIHGGGFGGTVQAFVPDDLVDEFISALDAHFGQGSCTVLQIADGGAWAQALG